MTGIVNENRGEHDLHPHRIAISLIDMFTGLLGLQAIATSLYARRELKHGRFIEASLMQGGAMLSVIRLIANYLERGTTQRTGMPSGVFNTADGQLNVTMVRATDWVPYCEAIGHPELAGDPRFAEPTARGENIETLFELVRPIFAGKPTAWLAERLTERGIMNGKVNTYEEFLQEAQVAATGIIAWLDQPGVPEPVPMPNIPGLPPFETGTRRAHAPSLGEHSAEVLAEHGYSEAEIADLLERKVIGGPQLKVAAE
jgi:crotonobetainyl-CoA:carnitine CoA-transferase CaiB-like acyl-CoA transferase